MAEGYWGTRISPHMIKQPDGSLICLGAMIGRTGTQEYKVSEIDKTSNDDSTVEVVRPVSEVTHPKTIASFEGVPPTGVGHPSQFSNPSNYSWIAKGHAQNIRIVGDCLCTESGHEQRARYHSDHRENTQQMREAMTRCSTPD
jgi:hypothetical protein